MKSAEICQMITQSEDTWLISSRRPKIHMRTLPNTQLIFQTPHIFLVTYADAAAAGSIRATGPPGESGCLAVRISTPSSVTSSVCSAIGSAKWYHDEFCSKTKLTELSCPRSVGRDTRPLVRPCHVPVGSQGDHGLDGKAHAWLRLTHCLVLRIMRHVGRAVEQLVDAVSAVCLDDGAFLRLCVLLDYVSVLAEQRARLHHLDGLVQTLSRCLHYADGIRICQSLVADVVCLVEIAVEAAVVEGHIDVQDVAVFENALVGYAVADDLVGRGADRLGEFAVVEGGWVCLYSVRIVFTCMCSSNVRCAPGRPCGQPRQCSLSSLRASPPAPQCRGPLAQACTPCACPQSPSRSGSQSCSSPRTSARSAECHPLRSRAAARSQGPFSARTEGRLVSGFRCKGRRGRD